MEKEGRKERKKENKEGETKNNVVNILETKPLQ
jgi:hypothetical protein